MHKIYSILTPQQLYSLEKEASENGYSLLSMMEVAGKTVAEYIFDNYKKQKVTIVCGLGNNAGDGFVIARRLAEQGWPVKVITLKDPKELSEISYKMAQIYQGSLYKYSKDIVEWGSIIVDAIFGIGLNKPLPKEIEQIIFDINQAPLKKVIAVDISSGVNAATGNVETIAIKADTTISFTAAKPGHILLPGKSYTGKLKIYDIGLPLYLSKTKFFINNPNLWDIPTKNLNIHKYSKGSLAIIGSQIGMIGATILSSIAASRMGTGIVKLICKPEDSHSYLMQLPSLITKPLLDQDNMIDSLSEEKIDSILIGPGLGTKNPRILKEILSLKKNNVIDADAITIMAGEERASYIELITNNTVLTPHQSEFYRLFKNMDRSKNKIEQTILAAQEIKCIIVYKGNDTVIASPDGRVAVNCNASENLATAGSGDVLSGIIASLLSQGFPGFEAATAGVWIHGEISKLLGEAIVAEDLLNKIPQMITKFNKW